MKIYGSITRLVDLIFRKSGFNVTVQPSTAAADTTFQLPAAGGGTKSITTSDNTASFTNKTFDPAGTGNFLSLDDSKVLVGNGSNKAVGVSISGDVTITNTGSVQIASGAIVNADINASAAIAYSKLAALTASRALQSDGSGFVSVSSVTSTELGYVSGVTSSIQNQLNALSTGLDWKNSVRAASTANVDFSTDLENGDTLDGVTLATGDRVLLKDQTAGEENGIYVVPASGAASRSTDADASGEVTAGLTVTVSEGTANADSTWQLSTDDPIVLNTTPLVFVKIANFGDHGSLAGLGDDDHTQYALLSGRPGKQSLYGASDADGYLELGSTSHSTKNAVRVSDGSGLYLAAVDIATDAITAYEASGLPDPAQWFRQVIFTGPRNTSGGSLYMHIADPTTDEDSFSNLLFNEAMDFVAARGSFASPDFCDTGDVMLALQVTTWDGSDFFNGAASIRAVAAENHSATASGTTWLFRTPTIGTTTFADRFSVDSSATTVYNGAPLVMKSQGAVKFYDSDNSNFAGIKANATTTADVTYTLPVAGPASNGYVLSSTTGGVLSWVSNAATSSFSTTWTSGTTKNVNHALGSLKVNVLIYEIDSPFEEVMVDSVAHTDANNIDLTSSEAPTGSGWQIVVTVMG